MISLQRIQKVGEEKNMTRQELVKKSLKYMENHLDGSLSVQDIAKEAGYSLSHFSRVFRDAVGMPPMEYVKKRKLIYASQEILNGRKIIDAAMDMGYTSHSGFTKAFCHEFGFSPAFLKAMKMHLEEGGGAMNHVFMKQTDPHMTKEELLARLKKNVTENQINLSEKEIQAVYDEAVRVYEGKTRYSGDEYVTHPLCVAVILADMEAEPDCVLAGMMCDVLKKTNAEPGSLRIPKRVKELVLKVNNAESGTGEQPNRDVLLVTLAERLHNMRSIEYMDKSTRQKKAEETLEVFLPMAARLGNEKLTAELNDLALTYLE